MESEAEYEDCPCQLQQGAQSIVRSLQNDTGNPDKFDKLITALRTAVDNDGTLDKEATSYNGVFDAFRLALNFYNYEVS